MLYITNLDAVKPAVEERVSNQVEIRARVDKWVLETYGIKNFSHISRTALGIQPGETCFALCRQIPSVRTEDIVCRIVGDLCGFPLLSLSFLDDTFSCDNHEKKSYLHVKWADWGRKKNLFFHGERLVPHTLQTYTGLPLSAIETGLATPGTTVADFHFGLRQNLFSDDKLKDVSELHRTYVRAATRRPEQLFSWSEGKTGKVASASCNLQEPSFRPPSSWYYPLFFSWFLDGSLVLLETYDNELAQVSKAKCLFEETMSTIKKATGLEPLVLQIPPLDEQMLAMPKKFIDDPGAIAKLRNNFSDKVTGDSVNFFRQLADGILMWQP